MPILGKHVRFAQVFAAKSLPPHSQGSIECAHKFTVKCLQSTPVYTAARSGGWRLKLSGFRKAAIAWRSIRRIESVCMKLTDIGLEWQSRARPEWTPVKHPNERSPSKESRHQDTIMRSAMAANSAAFLNQCKQPKLIGIGNRRVNRQC